MLFERDRGGAFLPPETFDERSLVTFSTHDLPTFTGWLAGHDLTVRGALDIPSSETAKERQDAIRAFGEALRTRGTSDVDFTSVVHYLAATPAKLLAVALEDVLEVREQANMPGTIDIHPNWRRKLPLEIERLKDDPRLRRIARIAADSGRAARLRA
jgi:4-alpha-glucanotransferase